ncbi:phage tail assembly protein [Bradyrhizobium septentrionale]|uniref:Phage tail assembly protein n=1 Tax=Bradyrhizobium septentrionale TaxID=1404411 RepID=A0A973VXB1_9BRAD|nr:MULTISPECIES: phage tail assembly protein [Bradyrhizobium]UGY12524.1 phage tail assembly protein [Bradyrhizobium septentrionale]UGY16358.1 phage tail assembly protein [Bradyrhizobium septentrionale]UGY21519.1 phage tail assembly protein [Bradyrhizobium septentrionale]UGY24704.1 phage tail assembly protein [Bradyrhizobium septentrionale]UGY24996.1 phage tail assembly protein [Bradyrhizobium septentrionale]
MNVKPRHEGFVDDKPEPEIIPPSGTKRAVPPPEIEPSPDEVGPLEQDEWPIIVKLIYKPIRNNRGEDVREISLREPRAGDINRYGNPIRVNQDGDVLIDERKMSYMIAALSGVLPPFIEEMDPRDWNSCAYRLRRFFLPDPAAW